MSPWVTPIAVMKTERVVKDVIGQVIPANTSWMLSIPLDRVDYTRGELVLSIPAAVSHPLNSRSPGFYKFGKALNDAQGIATDVSTNLISLCTFYDRWPSGYAYRNDGRLSNTMFDSGGLGAIQLTSIQINGASIGLEWKNVSIVSTATLTVYITADVWKV